MDTRAEEGIVPLLEAVASETEGAVGRVMAPRIICSKRWIEPRDHRCMHRRVKDRHRQFCPACHQRRVEKELPHRADNSFTRRSPLDGLPTFGGVAVVAVLPEDTR